MSTSRPDLRRSVFAALALAALVTPLTSTPASASHISVVDITRTACTDEVERDRFADVAPDSTFAPAIDCVAWWGITTGNTPTTYNPSANVTRVQMAVFVQRLADILGADFSPWNAMFSDIDGVSDEARQAINQLANAGVVTGTSGPPNKTYSPYAPVTRAQMAAYLNRLQHALDGQGFNAPADYFDDDNGSQLQHDINALASAGIVSGTGADRTYNPAGLVTRAQMAGFLTRYLEQYLASNVQADLTAPVTVARGTVAEFEYVVDNPAGEVYDTVELGWYLDSEAGLTAGDVMVEFRQADGTWERVRLDEQVPGGRGPLSTYAGEGPRFAVPADGAAFGVRLTVSQHALPGELAIFTDLSAPTGDGQLEPITGTVDVVDVT